MANRTLPETTRRTLEVAASEPELPLATLAVLLAEDGLSLADLEPAEDEAIVRLDDGLARFAVKGTAAAMFAAASPPRRRALHRRLASSLDDPARRLWHHSLAVLPPNDDLAADLLRHAQGSRHCAAFVRRAAELTSDPIQRSLRLLEAARQAARVRNLEEAHAALDAIDVGHDVLVRAHVAHLRLSLSAPMLSGLPAAEGLLTEAAGVEAYDADLAARMYAAAALAASGADVATVVRAAEESRRIAPHSLHATLACALAAVAQGRPEEAQRLSGRALEEFETAETAETVRLLYQFSVVMYYLEDDDQARALLEHAVTLSRTHGLREWLATILDTLAAIELRAGRLSHASAKSTEALRLARAAGDSQQTASCLTTLAAVDAITGRERSCRSRTKDAETLAPESELVHIWATLARGELDLVLGRPANVTSVAARMNALFASIGGFPMLNGRWLPVLIESHARLGDAPAAAEVLVRLQAVEAEVQTRAIRAIVARCRGLITRGEESRRSFEGALELHTGGKRPFELARTELCYGESLRRSRQRRSARLHLESALAIFEQLRAEPWCANARRELAALGTPRSDAVLSPHERRVAALVTGGATNREAAAELFVTQKTVEHHLTNIYAKLGVRSRTELTRIFLGAS